MQCPNCHRHHTSQVKDSREKPKYIRRRRICRVCDARFSTLEFSENQWVKLPISTTFRLSYLKKKNSTFSQERY
jgi:transcriptional regulator NrdR family protein